MQLKFLKVEALLNNAFKLKLVERSCFDNVVVLLSLQGDTFANFETMTDRLVREIVYYMEVFRVRPKKVRYEGKTMIRNEAKRDMMSVG